MLIVTMTEKLGWWISSD